MLWQDEKQAREQELKCLRELGVIERVNEHTAVAKYNVTSIDTKWVDTDKAFEWEPMQIRSRIVAREFESGDRPDLNAGTPPPEALNAIIPIAVSHSPEFSLKHVDVYRAYIHAKGQRLVLVKLPAEDCSGKDKGENWTLEKEHVRYQRCSNQLETRLAMASRQLGSRAGCAIQETCSTTRKGKPLV